MIDERGITSLGRAVIEAKQERLDKELYGAWRAGYDYLHTVEYISSGFRARPGFLPSDSRFNPFDRGARSTYDLRDEALTMEEKRKLYEYEP